LRLGRPFHPSDRIPRAQAARGGESGEAGEGIRGEGSALPPTMDILRAPALPCWVHELRMALSILVTAACGAHAWHSLRAIPSVPSALRAVSFLYAAAFFFAAWANSVMLLATLLAGRYQRGPYHLGTFTLLLVVSYVLTAGIGRRPSSA